MYFLHAQKFDWKEVELLCLVKASLVKAVRNMFTSKVMYLCFQTIEPDSALALFKWSAEKLGLMYNTYIGNGDSKFYQNVAKPQSYGPLQFIVKE